MRSFYFVSVYIHSIYYFTNAFIQMDKFCILLQRFPSLDNLLSRNWYSVVIMYTYLNGPASSNYRLPTVNVLRKESMVTSASTYNYIINDYKLQWSSRTRDLGIYVDNDLKLAQQISKITQSVEWF